MTNATVSHSQEHGLCAYVRKEASEPFELVYQQQDPREIQRVFMGVAIGYVNLGGAEFRGDSLRIVAREAVKAWGEEGR